ncbi:MAG: 4-hydroxy-tetrahydrodipicolinate synthase [Rhodocyclaceae bacterium]|nr:4-hydroxy-tetrahydrodipicolinate synthase [Rhodocyclaceae bacterium]
MITIQGSLPALVTPMTPAGEIDWQAYRRLIDWHIAEGSDGLVVVGTTGESPTVDFDEHRKLIEVAVEQANGRIPIIAGTGANATREAVELAKYAQAAGAAAHLSVVPYYNKPTQEGLYRHFRAIAEAVDLPLILYNVPGRTVADLANDTALRLAELPGVIGIKDATGNLERGQDLIRRAPSTFAVYSGDDPTAAALMLLGGKGVISVTANVAPRLMHELAAAALAKDAHKTRVLNERLQPLHKELFCEANPIPVKWALMRMGLIADGLRLPLTPLSASCHERVLAALAAAGISVR